jgi:AraC-like DNA-binding protein
MTHKSGQLRNAPLVNMGLTGYHGPAGLMPLAHRHNEVELNYVAAGAITYSFGGREATVAAGQVALFWAALPHRTVQIAEATIFTWLTVPLAVVLHWHLPPDLQRPLLDGKILLDPPTPATLRLALDRLAFPQWAADLQPESGVPARIVLLEIEARLRRLALDLAAASPAGPALRPPVGGEGVVQKADRMAEFISAHYTEPLRVADIAGRVGLHPNYAMTLFRARHGLSIGDYLTQHRVAHAQRLLVTTEAGVLAIALDSGFHSLSRFYVAFRRMCGQSPQAFRAALI